MRRDQDQNRSKAESVEEELHILKNNPHFLRVLFFVQFSVFLLISGSSDDKVDWDA